MARQPTPYQWLEVRDISNETIPMFELWHVTARGHLATRITINEDQNALITYVGHNSAMRELKLKFKKNTKLVTSGANTVSPTDLGAPN